MKPLDSRISAVVIHRPGWEWRSAWMGKPYLIDLRERAIAAVLQGGLSRHESAARFGVTPSTVINCPAFSRDGQRHSGSDGRAKPRAIAREHAVFLARRVRDGAFTWRGLVAELVTRALRSIIDRCGISFTLRGSASKKPFSPASAIGLTSRGGASSARSARAGSTPSVWCSSTRPGRRPTWSPLRGWVPRGERPVTKVPHGHCKTMTFVASLRHDRIETPHLRRRGLARRALGGFLL
jgi:transposase